MLPESNTPTLQKFLTPDSYIFDTAHWVLVLRPVQTTLAATILISKSAVEAMAELSVAEAEDLHTAWAKISAMYAASFAPDKLNYLALMMVDPNPHFHVIPRYAERRSFDAAFYEDKGWPKPPELANVIAFTPEQRLKLVSQLRAAAAS